MHVSRLRYYIPLCSIKGYFTYGNIPYIHQCCCKAHNFLRQHFLPVNVFIKRKCTYSNIRRAILIAVKCIIPSTQYLDFLLGWYKVPVTGPGIAITNENAVAKPCICAGDTG